MKWSLALIALFAVAPFASAQDQEQKLVDRLLKPKTELRNSEQNKHFIADGAPVTKRATVGAFYFQQKSHEKQFAGAREFSTQDFNSNPFYAGRNASKFEAQAATDWKRSASTSTNKSVHAFHDRDKAAQTHDFDGNRPFLEKGKSQKFLDRKNDPMTIEQVRELLNKN